MSKEDTMERRLVALTGLGTIALIVAGCGSGSPTSTTSGTPTADAAALEGTYTLEWTEEDLAAVLVAAGEDPAVAARDAANNAGALEVHLDGGTFGQEWTSGPGEGDRCDGTYVVSGDRFVLTASTDIAVWDCGSEWLGTLMIDAAWSLDGTELTFSDFELSEELDIRWWNWLYFGTQPLVRSGGEATPSAAGTALTLAHVGRFADAQIASFR